MNQAITAKIVGDAISGQITADAITGDSVTEQAIKFLDNCDYEKLSCGGAVAHYRCDSVLRIRELITEYSTRWLISDLVEV